MPLADVNGLSIGEREFFLSKGSGWALREFSKTDPDSEFIATHSGLSGRRETLKHVERGRR